MKMRRKKTLREIVTLTRAKNLEKNTSLQKQIKNKQPQQRNSLTGRNVVSVNRSSRNTPPPRTATRANHFNIALKTRIKSRLSEMIELITSNQ